MKPRFAGRWTKSYRDLWIDKKAHKSYEIMNTVSVITRERNSK